MLNKKQNWISAVLHSNVGRANFLFLVLFLNVGFVRSPFTRWNHGKVTSIAPGQLTLWIKDESSGTTNAFVWNQNTRLWMEPARRREPGVVFDPERLSVDSEVRVMFKTRSDVNCLSRVIQIAPPVERAEKST